MSSFVSFKRTSILVLLMGFMLALKAEQSGGAQRDDGDDVAAPNLAESSDGALSLLPYVVTAPAYKPVLTPLEFARLRLALDLPGLHGWPPLDGKYVITPERVPQGERNAVVALKVYDLKPLGPTDGGSFLALRIGAPTDRSGLARVGDMANGRSGRADATLGSALILMDGIRVNDPFDGTVRSSELSLTTASRIEIVPSGGATAWGGAPAGVVQVFTLPAQGRIQIDNTLPVGADPDYPPPPRQTVRRTGLLDTELGAFGAWRAEFVDTEPTSSGMFQFLGGASEAKGYEPVSQETRGPLDQPDWHRDHGWETRFRCPLTPRLELTVAIEERENARGLGTPYQSEQTRAQSALLQLAGAPTPWFAWNASAQAGKRARSRTFSAVDMTREHEIPVYSEIAEPVSTSSASWVGAWRHAQNARTNVGVDVSSVRGETRFQYDFSGKAYTRESVAGADQLTAGIFLLHHHQLGKRVSASIGLRVDALHSADGHVRESDLPGAVPIRNQRIEIADETQFSPSAGLVWAPRSGWVVRTSAQRSYRAPTLAERFRVTAQRDRLILPYASLKTAHGTNAECVIERTVNKALQFSARAYTSVYHDATATHGIGSGADAVIVPLSAAGLVERRERINIDRARISGSEFMISYGASKAWSCDAALTFQSSSIHDHLYVPTGTARQLPSVPMRAAFGGTTWSPTARFSLRAQLRWLGREFTNEENTRRLGEALVGDLAATFSCGSTTRLFLRVENVGNVAVVSDVGLNGTRYLSPPRSVSGGVRIAW